MLNNTISITKSKFSPTGVISLIFPIAYSGIVLIVLYLFEGGLAARRLQRQKWRKRFDSVELSPALLSFPLTESKTSLSQVSG